MRFAAGTALVAATCVAIGALASGVVTPVSKLGIPLPVLILAIVLVPTTPLLLRHWRFTLVGFFAWLMVGLYIFILAGFLGYHLITRVPPLLHTPLMSATNAMSGISLVGSLVVAGSGHGALSTAFGFIAVACSTTNVVGGFLITDSGNSVVRKVSAALAGLP